MTRFRDLLSFDGVLPPGPLNAITDVPGVRVGHTTLRRGTGAWSAAGGPYRTGVTLILPHGDNLYEAKVPAAVHTINGFGKVAGWEQVRELGNVETPIALTATLNVPRVADALLTLALEQNPYIGLGFAATGRQGYASVNPVVGETNDGYLSDMQGRPIGLAEVRAAYDSATTGPVTEGAVGAGTGTTCFGWKGGIGSASRRLPDESGGFVVGALVQTNFGRPQELTIRGVPIGRHLLPPPPAPSGGGSILIILATDAPLDPHQLGRLCRRASFGLARTGSTCHGSSGDFVLAFSTARRIPDRPPALEVTAPTLYEQPLLSTFSVAVIEAVEEAIYNSLFAAETVVGRDGHTRHALPHEAVVALLMDHGAQRA